MQSQAGRTFSGKSGTLYLDSRQRIHRLLAWADMDQGLAHISGYAPRMPSPLMGQTPEGLNTPIMSPDDLAGQPPAADPAAVSPR